MVASNDNVSVQSDAGRGISLNYIYFNNFINNLIKYLLIVFSQKTSIHKWPIKSSKQKCGIRVEFLNYRVNFFTYSPLETSLILADKGSPFGLDDNKLSIKLQTATQIST